MAGRDAHTFYFRGTAAGCFLDRRSPLTTGGHRYKPCPGPGHDGLTAAARAGDRPRCFQRLADRTRHFVVTALFPPFEVHVAEVEDRPPRRWPGTQRLADVLARVAAGDALPEHLYLPHPPAAWTADSPTALLSEADVDELHEEAVRNGLSRGAAAATAAEVVRAAREHLGIEDGEGRAEALSYFVRFDLSLPHRGARDPTGQPKAVLQADRSFYDSLGAERPGHPCCAPGCGRGRVALSAFCRVHHFEQVYRRHCPFSD
ncbi:MAG TPA: hypothetical protein VF796_06990 [Humisphaera sp.]